MAKRLVCERCKLSKTDDLRGSRAITHDDLSTTFHPLFRSKRKYAQHLLEAHANDHRARTVGEMLLREVRARKKGEIR